MPRSPLPPRYADPVAIQIRKQREELVRTLLTVAALEVLLTTVSLGASALAFGCSLLVIAAVLAARRRWSTTVHEAELAPAPGALVFRASRGELRVDLDAVDAVLRLEPRVVLLRSGTWTYRVRLLERTSPSVLDGMLAQIPAASGARAAVFRVRATGWKLLPDVLAVLVVLVGLLGVVGLFSGGSRSMFLAGQPLVVVALLTVLVPLVPAWLTVGEDGLLVRDRWTRLFIPFSRIRSVTNGPAREFGSLRVELEDGSSRRLTSAPRPEADAMLAQIEERRRRHAEAMRAGSSASDGRLARAGRPLAAWRQDLEQPVAFRSTAPSPEELREVLASPDAPVEERVGAALALRRVPGEGEQRIRVAASTTANPELRVALEAIAEEELDEERLETALHGAATLHRAGA